MNDLVSIIVPCYKQAQYLDEALQSVLHQTYNNWECIIVNDGSPDNTKEIAQKWVAKDERFQYIFQENAGVSSARNLGILQTIGQFILPLDADDKISPDYVTIAMESFQEDVSLKLVYCKAEKFGDEFGLWNLKPFSLFNLSQKNMIFCSAVFKKNEWEKAGGYDENMIDGLEDWEFWIAILKGGGNVKCIDSVGFYYRVKDISRQKELNYENMKCLLEYMSVKHADFYVKQLGSFAELNSVIKKTKTENEEKLKSKKLVVDVFFKTFFGFSFFGMVKKNKLD